MDNNDTAEFAKFFTEYSDALLVFCMSRVADKEVAKDLVQETFVKTWSYLSQGKKVNELRPFLYTTLRHLIIDYYRKKKNVSLDLLMQDSHWEPSASIASDTIENEAEKSIILRLLKYLPIKYRKVIVLRFLNGLRFREIANLIGESENTVTVRFHRGLTKLKNFLLRRKN